MRAFFEVALSLLAVVGLLSMGWLFFGRLLAPAGGAGAVTVLPGRGDGEELEQAVRGLLWLRGSGLLAGRIVIEDRGMTAQGKAVAILLCLRDPAVSLCPAGELERYIG